MAPCLRACALWQSDRENAPPERFQAVLWGRADGGWSREFAGRRSSMSSCVNMRGHLRGRSLPPHPTLRAALDPDRLLADLNLLRVGKGADEADSSAIANVMLHRFLSWLMCLSFLLAGLWASGVLLPRPALARSAFGPDDLPLADRPGGPHPLACGLAPCSNRTVKTLHWSVFGRSCGRAVGARLRGR